MKKMLLASVLTIISGMLLLVTVTDAYAVQSAREATVTVNPPDANMINKPITPPVVPPVSNQSKSTSSGNNTSAPPNVIVNYFLKIDGIDGESHVADVTNAIEILSWSWGIVNPNVPDLQSTITESGDPHEAFHFTMQVNKASPKLMLSCATGDHIASVELIGVADTGNESHIFLTLPFDDVLVSSYSVSGGSNQVPMEEISLNFAKVESPQFDQTVLQEMANNRMDVIELKTNVVATTSLTAPTPRPSNIVFEYYLHSSGQQNSIELSSFSFGITNEDGKISQIPFNFTPKAGEPTNFITVTPPDGLDIRKQGGVSYLSFSFGKASTSSSGMSGTMSTVNPAEEFSLNFAKIEMNYGQQKVGWDFQANTPINEYNSGTTGPSNSSPLKGSATMQPHKTYVIPSYVHNVAKLWSEGQIDDTTFEMALQYLINKGIVHVPPTNQTSEQSTGGVPSWVKNLAGYYGKNQISDNDFGQAIEYMLHHGIIKINKLATMQGIKLEA